jgi:hypothetical protein
MSCRCARRCREGYHPESIFRDGQETPKQQVLSSIKVIRTVFKTVEDAETAFREATAARLALAKYKQIKQAFDDNDLGTVATLMNSVKDDDDSAGAALLRSVLLELRDKKQRGGLYSFNENKTDNRDANAEGSTDGLTTVSAWQDAAEEAAAARSQ